MNTVEIAQLFDHTVLKQSATKTDVAKLCAEAIEHQFFSVCVNPFWIPLCKNILQGSSVKVCTVIGFPLGANLEKSKIEETLHALEAGAQEIDCVMNVGALKSGNLMAVSSELKAIVHACKGRALVKVIVESGVLSQEELMSAIKLVNESGAEFIKTSTGFAEVGATTEAVAMMKKFGRPGLKIKASGGIRSAAEAELYIRLGVDRIGASKSTEILQQLVKSK